MASNNGTSAHIANLTSILAAVKPGQCLCGCGRTPSSSRASYCQGHDARHASMVAQIVAADLKDGVKVDVDASPAFQTYGLKSPSLISKARAQVLKTTGKAPEKAAKLTKWEQKQAEKAKGADTPDTLGTVREGRWIYPARLSAAGEVTRNTKRDGSGEWVETTAAFQVA